MYIYFLIFLWLNEQTVTNVTADVKLPEYRSNIQEVDNLLDSCTFYKGKSLDKLKYFNEKLRLKSVEYPTNLNITGMQANFAAFINYLEGDNEQGALVLEQIMVKGRDQFHETVYFRMCNTLILNYINARKFNKAKILTESSASFYTNNRSAWNYLLFMICVEAKDYENAEKYRQTLKSQLKYDKKNKNNVWANIMQGIYFSDINKRDSAEYYLLAAQSMNKSNDSIGLELVCSNYYLGELYNDYKDPRARLLIEKAISISQKAEFRRYLIAAYLELAAYYQSIEDKERWMSNLEKAEEELQKFDVKTLNIRTIEQFIKHYKDIKSPKLDEFIKLASLKTSNDLDIGHDLKYIETELKLATTIKNKAANEELSKAKMKNMIYLIVLSLLGIVVVVRLFKIFATFANKKVQYDEASLAIDHKIERISSENEYILLKNEILEGKKVKILDAIDDKQEVLERTRSAVIKIGKETHHGLLNFDLQIDKSNLSEFLFSEHNLTAEFVKKIRSKHETLTEQEMIMCCLIRLGVKNIEMSRILMRSANGLKVAKHRLKTKLQLGVEDELSDYISSL